MALAAEGGGASPGSTPPADAHDAQMGDDDLGGTVRFPLEGGTPCVTTPSAAVAPGVSKQLMARGTAEAPPCRDDKCFVHYTAWTADTGEEVDNTRDSREPAQIIVARDVAHRAGMGAALLTMAPGERALVRVDGSGAYGAEGHFSFPAVAPHAALLYDVELLRVERASAEHAVKPRGDMLWEERMAAAARYRDGGNAAFRAGNHAEALAQYTAGLSFIDDGMMAQLMGRYMDESSELKAALHANCAAAALGLSRWDDALAQAGAALALAPRHAKALYRKGKAHAALGQDDAARDALQRAAEVDPEDAGVRAALKALDAEEAAKRRAARKTFGGLFGAAPPPQQQQAEAETQPAQPPAVTPAAPATQPAASVMQRVGAWWRGSS